MGDQTMFAIDHQDYALETGDAFDRTVAAARAVSGIAMDVFGIFFWSALGLLLVAAIV